MPVACDHVPVRPIPRPAIQTLVALTCGVAALVFTSGSPARAVADGGSGTYSAAGSTYGFDLQNAGTTPWQYFYLVGPAGTTFVGGATAGEITARCVAGQPDGSPAEIECGPLSATGLQPNVQVAFVATLGAPPACGAVFQLEVSSTGSLFTRVGDVTFAGSCSTIPEALTRPVIRGAPRVGKTLSVAPASWSAAPTLLAYQWQRCTSARCQAIGGATGLTHTLTAADAGRSLRVVAAATFAGTRVTSVSKPVAVRRAR